jgi:hypothetical protein
LLMPSGLARMVGAHLTNKGFATANQDWYAPGMRQPTLEVRFFKTDNRNEPVREWLRGLSATDKKP